MFKKVLFTTLWLAIMASSVFAGAGKKTFPYDYKVERLENGLEIIIIPMPVKGSVAYYSVVRTGSRDEVEKNRSGFAHFFEHMMFRGSVKYPAGMYDKIVTGMGANANAYTTDDYTCYHLNITSEDLEKVIEIESDRFQNLSYPEQEFKTESQAVYGEYRKGKTSPFFQIFETLQAAAFKQHTYGHTTMGFEEDIKLMPEMFNYSKTFFNKYYRPENVKILVVGDVKHDKVMKLIKKYYSGWKKGYQAPDIKPEPMQKEEIRQVVDYPGNTLPILTIAYRGSAFNPADKMNVASYLLGELAFGGTSELNKKLVLNEQKVQMLEHEFGQNRDPFLWCIFTMVKDKKDMDYVEKQIYAAIDKFKKEPVSAQTLEDLKKRYKYSFLMHLDTPENVAGGLARYLAIAGNIDVVDKFYEAIDAITPQDIKEAANNYFYPSQRTVITLFGKE